MKKHTTTAGPTGLTRIRSLVAFRHQNSAARLVSTLAAFAIAMLLVPGTGAAYADDTTPDPAATDTAAAAADPAPDSSAGGDASASDQSSDDQTSAPAADDSSSAPGSDAAKSDAATSAAAATTAPAGEAPAGPVATTLKKIAAAEPAAAPVDVTVPCDYAATGSTTVPAGDFEIDGNLCKDGDPTVGASDWDSIDFGSDAADNVNDGFNDGTTFTQGDSENNDPSTWHIDGPAPNGKSDIGTAYAYSQAAGGEVYGYFAFTNSSTSGGTQQYDVEYNKNDATVNANGATVPVRSEGDLLFRFHSTGNDPLVFDDAKIYRFESNPLWDDASCFEVTSSSPAGGWCDLPDDPTAFVMKSSADGLFQEGVIQISKFFPNGACSGDFSTVQIRSVTGNAFATSALKDYVYPLAVHTPSTCGSLVIKKKDANTGDLVAGAVFGITGDPRPGGDPADTYCVFDGVEADMPAEPAECDIYVADGTADGTITVDPVEPGTYTVTELVAPPGYLLAPEPDPGNSQEVTVGESASETLEFDNHLAWQPLTVTKTADGHFGAAYFWTINKQIAPTAAGPWSDDTTPGAPLVKTVDPGGNTSLYYRAVVHQDHVTTSDFVVDGAIHVANPNDGAVHATIAESLSGCTLDSNHAAFPVTVDVPSGVADYAYTCDLGADPGLARTNTATVTWDKSDYPQTADDIGATGDYSVEGSDPYTFTESASNKTITVTDDHFVFNPAWAITWGDEADGTYESAVYSTDTHATAGTCSAVITNTAKISGDEAQTLDQDSESGQVCMTSPPLPPLVSPPAVEPAHPAVLPATGGPDAGLLAAGLVLLLGGGTLVAGDRRRRRRS